MSSLLKEAIVDAKALREAALKNAETIVIEKYSDEVKSTLSQLLEQDEMALDMGADPAADPAADPMAADPMAADPMAAELPADPAMGEEEAGAEEVIEDEDELPLASTDDFADLDGKNLGSFPETGENVEVSIDLGALQEAVKNLKENQEFEINEEELFSMLSEEEEEDSLEEDAPAGVEAAAQQKADEDDMDEITEEDSQQDTDDDGQIDAAVMGEADGVDSLVDAIMEKLTVDMGADLSGWAGRSDADMRWQMEKEMAHRRSSDVEENLETLKKAQEELVFENKQLEARNNQYEQVLQELKDSLQDVNLSNARLLYTNRVLRNTSLNERQKSKIVEAISSAGSVTEAKTIYDTLQSTVEAAPKRSPKSLSEAISRRSSVIRATRHDEPSSDPFTDRMKRLAGIK